MPWIAKRRTRQPPRLVTPDLSDFGLRVAFAFNAADPPRDAISGALNTGTSSGGGLDFRGGEGGVAAFSSATQNRGLSYSGVVVGADITVFAIISDNVGGGAVRALSGCDSSTAGNRTWLFQINASNQLDFTVFNTAGSAFIAAGGTAINQEPIVVAGRLAGTTVRSFMNGVQMGSAALTGTPRTTTGKPVFVGNTGRNNVNSMRGDLYEVFIVDGAVPDELIKAWNSPEALRAAMYPPRRIWVPFTSGGGGGAQELLPPLVDTSAVIYAPTVSSTYNLLPPLLDASASLFAPVVSVGVVELLPPLLDASAVLYAPTVSLAGGLQSLQPPLLDASATLFAPSVSYTIQPPLLTNGQTFYAPTVTVGTVTLRPPLLNAAAVLYAPSVSGGAVVIKARGLRKTRYVPGRVPARTEELARFLQSEIERLNDALESPFTHQLLEKLHVEPTRLRDGFVAYADGTDWNPGSGEGVYVYYASAWHKLG